MVCFATSLCVPLTYHKGKIKSIHGRLWGTTLISHLACDLCGYAAESFSVR